MSPLDLIFYRAYNSRQNNYHQLLATELLSPTHFYFFCKSPNETCQANNIALRILREAPPNSLQVKDLRISDSYIRCYAISEEHSFSFNQILLREQSRILNTVQIFTAQNDDLIIIPPAINIICFDDS